MSSKFDTRNPKLTEELALQEVTVDARPETPTAAPLPPLPAGLTHSRPSAQVVESEALAEESARPLVDIAETGEIILFTIDVPGLEQKDVDVLISRDILTIRGMRPAPADEITGWHLRERTRALVERVILIPEGVDTDDATFQVRNGVLTVRMSRTSRPRKNVTFAS